MPYTKVNSKCSHNLNIRRKTVKPLEENTGQKRHNTEFGNDFLDVILKGIGHKWKSRQIGLHEKFKNFAHKTTAQWKDISHNGI